MSVPSKDALRELTHSTLTFYERFGVTPKLENTIMVFEEEVGELIEAARDGNDKQHIGEEAADVFVTAIGLCHAAGVEIDEIIEQVYAVIAKNDAKTHDTHHYVDGKIRRRSKS